ncbi:[FeFe] hydrogenase H-cluster radical SAM maturase HydE [Sediminispirochaeta smaragdinae]|uniref:Radical SAM domain protein n=1 Tax=Sediminispirochaeta smaragdinae (strain DSM 11293 / JCM 15392 / SEBR 4228) TaxID=573413 RepID=E1R3U9_SEDSS|nr:[FeFe] hydrogenase H-cluster radical SAM maturase HydE [Sediminispirochaeta smaragdinae]ADK82070.1 Radical SAM domain protein [Sediminispirochaeta smaragdinae DSM 11293]
MMHTSIDVSAADFAQEEYIHTLRHGAIPSEKALRAILSIPYREKALVDQVRYRAMEVMEREVGNLVYYRGIVEFSNICTQNCRYCGIRRSNTHVSSRYLLDEEEIVESALWCAERGYGSVVLQSGERRDEAFIELVERIVKTIKERSRSTELPDGVGITLSVGEQTLETYRRFYNAGAHRYLLRIETSNPELFSAIHPPEQRFETRLQALHDLRKAGFQVGTGVMIGIPGQSIDMLARDILFFREIDVDMIGMGPYITHPDTPMAVQGMMEKEALLHLSLLMIAATRLALPDANIAATTALQALVPDGRERGLRFGANVTMPNITPLRVREAYRLYENKPCMNERKEACEACLAGRIASTGRSVGLNAWGDSPRFFKRKFPRE